MRSYPLPPSMKRVCTPRVHQTRYARRPIERGGGRVLLALSIKGRLFAFPATYRAWEIANFLECQSKRYKLEMERTGFLRAVTHF